MPPCKEAIEKAISEHYCDNVLHREAVAQVAEQFGHERILYVLAITIRQKDWDGRFSADNKQWAKTVPVAENPDAWGTDRNCYLAANSHSGLVDLFTKLAREDARAHERRPSVLVRLKSRPPRSGGGGSQKDKGAVPVSAQFMRPEHPHLRSPDGGGAPAAEGKDGADRRYQSGGVPAEDGAGRAGDQAGFAGAEADDLASALHEQQHQPDRQTAQREWQNLRHRPCRRFWKSRSSYGDLPTKFL